MTRLTKAKGTIARRTVAALKVRDERSFRHVALYGSLKEILRRSRYRFGVLSPGTVRRDDHALFLNLTYWSADAGGDIVADGSIDADVVTHVAWHHLAARALARPGRRASAASLLLGEAIASAFDLYLVGRLLGHAPRSTFLQTQIPAMAETARSAGLSTLGFRRLLEDVAARPDWAFEGMRTLLYDAGAALFAARNAGDAYRTLLQLEERPLGALLHRFELSNWVLYARAFAGQGAIDRKARQVDRALRAAESAVEWLSSRWVEPALAAPIEPSDA